jgi:hypothetical protein
VQQLQKFAGVDFVIEGGPESFGAVFNVFFGKGCQEAIFDLIGH